MALTPRQDKVQRRLQEPSGFSAHPRNRAVIHTRQRIVSRIFFISKRCKGLYIVLVQFQFCPCVVLNLQCQDIHHAVVARPVPAIIHPARANPSGPVCVQEPLPVGVACLPLAHLPGGNSQDFQRAGRSKFGGCLDKGVEVAFHRSIVHGSLLPSW